MEVSPVTAMRRPPSSAMGRSEKRRTLCARVGPTIPNGRRVTVPSSRRQSARASGPASTRPSATASPRARGGRDAAIGQGKAWKNGSTFRYEIRPTRSISSTP